MDLGTKASVDTLGECATKSQILTTELGICGQPKCYPIHVEEFFEKTESVLWIYYPPFPEEEVAI